MGKTFMDDGYPQLGNHPIPWQLDSRICVTYSRLWDSSLGCKLVLFLFISIWMRKITPQVTNSQKSLGATPFVSFDITSYDRLSEEALQCTKHLMRRSR